MNDFRFRLIVILLPSIPYFLVSWGYMAYVDGGAKQFLGALGVLIALRTFFDVIEKLGGVLSWRVYGKKVTANKFAEMLCANKFPKREYSHHDFSTYLHQLEEGPSEESVKTSAKQLKFILEFCEEEGILLRMRMHVALDAALDIYSPRAEAPILDFRSSDEN